MNKLVRLATNATALWIPVCVATLLLPGETVYTTTDLMTPLPQGVHANMFESLYEHI